MFSVSNWIARVVGFICGYLFSSELSSFIVYIANKTHSIPSIFSILQQYDPKIATITFILIMLSIITIISRLRILTFIYWFLFGILVGILAPVIIPFIKERLESYGYNFGFIIWRI